MGAPAEEVWGWIAVRGRARADVLRSLALTEDGGRKARGQSSYLAAEAPGGWTIVLLQGPRATGLLDPRAIERLSAESEIVTCLADEPTMYSKVASWSAGREAWSVAHACAASEDDLLVTEAPDEVVARAKAHEAFAFDVPIEIARAVTGFRPGDERFAVLVPSEPEAVSRPYTCERCHETSEATVLVQPSASRSPTDHRTSERLDALMGKSPGDYDRRLREMRADLVLRYATCPRCREKNPAGIAEDRREKRNFLLFAFGLCAALVTLTVFVPLSALCLAALQGWFVYLGTRARRQAHRPIGTALASGIAVFGVCVAVPIVFPRFAFLLPVYLTIALLIGTLRGKSVSAGFALHGKSIRFDEGQPADYRGGAAGGASRGEGRPRPAPFVMGITPEERERNLGRLNRAVKALASRLGEGELEDVGAEEIVVRLADGPIRVDVSRLVEVVEKEEPASVGESIRGLVRVARVRRDRAARR